MIVLSVIVVALAGIYSITNQAKSSDSTTLSPNPGGSSILTTTKTSFSTGVNGTIQLYEIEFVQESNCPYGSWLFPWAVVLNNSTMIVQPSNATLPLTYSGTHLTSNSNYSAIWFSIPDGTYNYTVLPSNFYGVEQSGTVTISGSNSLVQVLAFVTAMGCSSTTTLAS